MKVSIIICYNNKELYAEQLRYIEEQSIKNDIEVIGIDNCLNVYKQAAKALNDGAEKAIGDVLIWMHQDILLTDKFVIEKIRDFLLQQNSTCLLGVAGVKSDSQEVYSAITETRDHLVRYSYPISEPIEVASVDECCLAMKKSDWINNRFDEKTCNDWHLYGVEMSYRIINGGGYVICFPAKICHLSTGNLNYSFYKSLLKVIKKYRKKTDYICSTCVRERATVKRGRYLLHRYRYLSIRHSIAEKLKKIGIIRN